MNQDQKQLLMKRFQTTMIGALFEFEKTFGYLWGQSKEIEDLTDRETEFNDLWEDVRNRILNNGNKQLRKAIVDLSECDTRYKYNFYTKKGEDK